jgi:NitT/TauT family transport system ATP-binding protein
MCSARHAQPPAAPSSRIRRALEHSSDGALREGFFIDLLASHHSRDEAEAQLDTAIDWGRYAELFEFDAGRGEIGLHVHSEQPSAH